ncbi:hypothetical protein OPQ81_007306 [Rhizoctonia solani]|nr:hypothetical protein OPQ81_007306 [Rhizoctonia solani]
MMAPPTNILDHIVHLSPPGKLSEAVAHWKQLGFEVTSGGTHESGLSWNALVILPDGIYIELLTFKGTLADLPESERWWAKNPPGWIAWACLGLENHIDQTIAERDKGFNSGVAYQEPREGSRKRETDGQESRWRVTIPRENHGLDLMPFFCEDLTPRKLRAPPANLDAHANIAVGIAHLHLKVPQAQLDQAKAQLSVVLNSQPNESGEWELVVPYGRYNPAPRLRVVGSGDGTTGIEEVGFYVKKGKEGDATDGFGKVVFTEL